MPVADPSADPSAESPSAPGYTLEDAIGVFPTAPSAGSEAPGVPGDETGGTGGTGGTRGGAGHALGLVGAILLTNATAFCYPAATPAPRGLRAAALWQPLWGSQGCQKLRALFIPLPRKFAP